MAFQETRFLETTFEIRFQEKQLPVCIIVLFPIESAIAKVVAKCLEELELADNERMFDMLDVDATGTLTFS